MSEEIHGWICDECGRTHCMNSIGCECHRPTCDGEVGPIQEVIGE